MTEIEKLRALLAEAREFVILFHEAGCPEDQCEGCAEANDMTQRIDAALAEPVARLNPYSVAVAEMRGDAWQKQAMQRERERDEARAEVERLRWLLSRAESDLALVSRTWTKPAFERGEHLPMIRATLAAIRALPVPKE
jgi:hypothetical protein